MKNFRKALLGSMLLVAFPSFVVLADAANPAGPPAYGGTPPLTSQYPAGSTPVVAVGTDTTGAVTVSLPAVANQTNYICKFEVSAIGGTAAVGPVTVANLIGNKTFTYQLSSTAAGTTFVQSFSPCIPAKATNTAITVTTTADGTATAVDVNVAGYVQ